jgi:hypothetical protein
MNVRVIAPLNFSAGIFHNDELRMNNYFARIHMYTNCVDNESQGIAMERLKHFVYGEMDSTIFINENNTEKCFQMLDCGLNITTLPGDPVDQLIGIMLYYKLSAVMEGRIIITDVEVSSAIGDNIIYVHSDNETPNLEISDWWQTADLNHCNIYDHDQEILSINRLGPWRELELTWPVEVEKTETDNTVVFADFGKDDKK